MVHQVWQGVSVPECLAGSGYQLVKVEKLLCSSAVYFVLFEIFEVNGRAA